MTAAACPQPAYRVDLDLMQETIDSLTRCEATCDRALDDVSRRVRDLHGTWSGLTAAAQADAQARWEDGFAQMRAGLAEMRGAAGTAHHNYTDAVDTNVRMWGSL